MTEQSQTDIDQAWVKARETAPRVDAFNLPVGIHFDIDFENYCRIPAVNKSSLALAKTSLAHYYFRPAPVDAPHFRLGSLIHAGKLEPEMLEKRYVVIPETLVDETQRLATTDAAVQEGRKPAEKFQPYASPKATKVYKGLLARFLAEHPGKQEVSQQWFDDMQGMLGSMDECPRSHALFQSGWPEVTLLWRDPETNLLCKARIDWLCEDADQADVKTANDIVRWRVEDWDYHLQAASYMEGYVLAWDQMTPGQRKKFPKSLDPYTGSGKKKMLRERQFHFCVVETVRPWTCLCAPVDDRVLRVGSDEYHFLLRRLAASQAELASGVDAKEAFPAMQPPKAWTFGKWFKEGDFPLYQDFGEPLPTAIDPSTRPLEQRV